jgi:hypothetical protein
MKTRSNPATGARPASPRRVPALVVVVHLELAARARTDPASTCMSRASKAKIEWPRRAASRIIAMLESL